MQEQFRSLVDALVGDEEFREAFMNAPDQETRMSLAADKGLSIPSYDDMSAATEALGDDGVVPDNLMSAGFWMSAFWMPSEE